MQWRHCLAFCQDWGVGSCWMWKTDRISSVYSPCKVKAVPYVFSALHSVDIGAQRDDAFLGNPNGYRLDVWTDEFFLVKYLLLLLPCRVAGLTWSCDLTVPSCQASSHGWTHWTTVRLETRMAANQDVRVAAVESVTSELERIFYWKVDQGTTLRAFLNGEDVFTVLSTQ